MLGMYIIERFYMNILTMANAYIYHLLQIQYFHLFFIFFCLFLFEYTSSLPSSNILDICQSGIREDQTNYVHCARKSLYSIPRFSNRTFNLAFDELILSDNFISHINANDFNGLRVKRLIMSGNKLQSMDSQAFRELTNYLEQTVLEFDSAIVDTIPIAIKTNLQNIRSLKLIGLNLQTLTSGNFDLMKKLEHLSLTHCNIHIIDHDAFQPLEPILKHLQLDYNQLTEMNLNPLQQLEILTITQNQIKYIDNDNLPKQLKRLDLSYNGLTDIQIELSQLEYLNVQNNQLTQQHLEFIHSLTNIKELILDFNSIQTLNDETFSSTKCCQQLELLSLQGNDFDFNRNDQGETNLLFSNLKQLQRLNLARNTIKIIPTGLFNFTRTLQSLNLDRNPSLKLSSTTFYGLESSLINISLQACNLRSNSLSSLKILKNLERIKLSSNDIDYIPDDLFISLINLTLVDLQRNQLEMVPIFNDQNRIKELELSGNKLKTFNEQTLKQLKQLVTLDLSSNPLECDCQLKSLYKWLKDKFQPELIQYLQWTCSNGKQLSTLNIDHFICNSVAATETTTTITTTKFKEILSTAEALVRDNMESITTTTNVVTDMITDLNVWIKDNNSAIIEWNTSSTALSRALSLRLLVIENGYPLPSLNLNISQRYFLLEKLKSQTQYTICLTILNSQKYCRDLITDSTTTSTSLAKSVFISKTLTTTLTSTDLQYLILGTVLGAISVLLILIVIIIVLVRKQRLKKHKSSKTTSIESYYNAGGSDISALSLEQQPTLKCLSPPPSLLTPFYYFLPSECPHSCASSSINGVRGGCLQHSETNSTDLSNNNPPAYHIYHEIPFSDPDISTLRRQNIFGDTCLIEQQRLRHKPIII
ncbi:unnamed protein product [Didymodactylos carnosus]|uniref:LRRCT domain-containing protein n=1 Tax=Didymodactylos carnosus TaxID=1234261 RepID=A0A8S2DC47_9BILA|nr:unnamed protein product [Didymodactylos carnosus]CAF3640804.1 unnamed protein product [Didymodactylos carnosus]